MVIPSPSSKFGALATGCILSAAALIFSSNGLETSFASPQGGIPGEQIGYKCEDVNLGEQCGNESSTTDCGGLGAMCTFCDAPNGSAFVLRCIPMKDFSCINLAGGGPKDVDCGVKQTGTCNAQGACINASPGINCSPILARGCQDPP